jgi:VWFA-related protein
LLKAIDSFTPGFRGQSTAGVGAANYAAAATGGRSGSPGTGAPITDTGEDLWYLYSVGLLDRAVEYLTDVAERRKAIIYIGEGIPFDIAGVAGTFNATPGAPSGGASAAMLQQRIKEQMDDLFDRAQRSNVTIYTIDACGLRAQPTPPVPGARTSTATCIKGLDSDYLENVAVATGGRAVVNTNDFDPGLNAVFRENSSYYLLGFAPADPAHDGKFRTVEVRVNRPGLDVRTRSGYDAPRDLPADRPKPAASPLMKALAGVIPKSDLPMQITGAAFAYVGDMTADKPAVDDTGATDESKKGDKKKAKEKKSDASKPAASVLMAVAFRQPIRQSDERAVENVDLQISAFDSDGRSYGNFHQRADVTIRPGSTGEAEYEVFGQINLKPGRYQLRIAANLASFADSGSVYYDIDVPDFANEPLTMSGILLSSTPNPQYAPKNGLKPTVPIIPTTRRVFSAQYAGSAFARVYQGGKAKPVAATVRMTIRDEKDAVVIERKQDLPASLFSTTRATDLQLEVPMKELQAGAYLLTIETTAGVNTVRRDSRFSIAK